MLLSWSSLVKCVLCDSGEIGMSLPAVVIFLWYIVLMFSVTYLIITTIQSLNAFFCKKAELQLVKSSISFSL